MNQKKKKKKSKINILLLYIRLNTQQEKKTEKKKSTIVNSNQVLIPTEKTKKEGKINNKKILEENDKRKFSKRYTIFLRIKIYLESNNILLSDFAKKNPFHSKPYEIRNSEEFLESVKFSNYDFVKEALNHNLNYLFVYDYFGQTAFHWAAKLGDLKMLKILINKGKNLNIKDYKGRTPIFFASSNNNFDCVKLLVENGGNVFMDDYFGKKPVDVTDNMKIKYYLTDIMDQPYFNPFIKKQISNVLKFREEIIQKRQMEEKFLKMEKNDQEKFENIVNESEEK